MSIGGYCTLQEVSTESCLLNVASQQVHEGDGGTNYRQIRYNRPQSLETFLAITQPIQKFAKGQLPIVCIPPILRILTKPSAPLKQISHFIPQIFFMGPPRMWPLAPTTLCLQTLCSPRCCSCLRDLQVGRSHKLGQSSETSKQYQPVPDDRRS